MKVQPRRLTEGADQFFVDNLYNLLARIQGAGNLGSDRSFTYSGNEILCHIVMNIGLQQGKPNFPQCGINILRRQFTPSPQLLKNLIESFGQRFKQEEISIYRMQTNQYPKIWGISLQILARLSSLVKGKSVFFMFGVISHILGSVPLRL